MRCFSYNEDYKIGYDTRGPWGFSDVYTYIYISLCTYIHAIYIYTQQMPGLCPEPQRRRATHHRHHHHQQKHHHHQLNVDFNFP